MNVSEVNALLDGFVQCRPEDYAPDTRVSNSAILPDEYSGQVMYFSTHICGVFTVDYNHMNVEYRDGKVIRKSLIMDYFDR